MFVRAKFGIKVVMCCARLAPPRPNPLRHRQERCAISAVEYIPTTSWVAGESHLPLTRRTPLRLALHVTFGSWNNPARSGAKCGARGRCAVRAVRHERGSSFGSWSRCAPDAGGVHSITKHHRHYQLTAARGRPPLHSTPFGLKPKLHFIHIALKLYLADVRQPLSDLY